MTDSLTTDDIEQQTVKRDSDGELIPEEHEIDWGGETKTVKTKPITTGLLNELSHIDDGIVNLDPSAVYEAIKTVYLDPDPAEFTEADIRDLEGEYLNALMSPIDAQIDESVGDTEGNQSPMDMDRQERAEQMR
jgi:hypothetical protein